MAEPLPDRADQQFLLGEAGPAQTGNTLAITDPGYIDSAIIRSRIRFRYDNIQGGNSDRAGFLYGTYLAGSGFRWQPDFEPSNGTVNGPTNSVIKEISYQELSTYGELKIADRFSLFADVPLRFNDTVEFPPNDSFNQLIHLIDTPGGLLPNARAVGIGDINAGMRYALIQETNTHVTFQLKTFIPTGDAFHALGTGHASIQPGVLFQKDYEKFAIFGEAHDWIAISDLKLSGHPAFPANGPDLDGRLFNGNVLRLGVGTAYHIVDNGRQRLSSIAEFVNWTVLDGLKSDIDFAGFTEGKYADARGDTIVNGKFGVRYNQGPHSIYVGYGCPFTEQILYSSIIRADYTYNKW
jgi:hypothetical protein